jgi:hypothetical protein
VLIVFAILLIWLVIGFQGQLIFNLPVGSSVQIIGIFTLVLGLYIGLCKTKCPACNTYFGRVAFPNSNVSFVLPSNLDGCPKCGVKLNSQYKNS